MHSCGQENVRNEHSRDRGRVGNREKSATVGEFGRTDADKTKSGPAENQTGCQSRESLVLVHGAFIIVAGG
jgi:hypothetical protein